MADKNHNMAPSAKRKQFFTSTGELKGKVITNLLSTDGGSSCYRLAISQKEVVTDREREKVNNERAFGETSSTSLFVVYTYIPNSFTFIVGKTVTGL